MTRRPRLLDLFCGAGGAAMGYHRAGFDVVGIDIEDQPNYPFEFHQFDAVTALTEWDVWSDWGDDFDAIHASPPCQAYTQLGGEGHPELIEPVRTALRAISKPYVIENVVGAPLEDYVTLCGSMFGLNVRRHRRFETSFFVWNPPVCDHAKQAEIRAYYGKKGWLVWTPRGAAPQRRDRKPLFRGSVEQAPADMGIDWMKTWDEVRESIPPAYTEFIGGRLMDSLSALAHQRREDDMSGQSQGAVSDE